MFKLNLEFNVVFDKISNLCSRFPTRNGRTLAFQMGLIYIHDTNDMAEREMSRINYDRHGNHQPNAPTKAWAGWRGKHGGTKNKIDLRHLECSTTQWKTRGNVNQSAWNNKAVLFFFFVLFQVLCFLWIILMISLLFADNPPHYTLNGVVLILLFEHQIAIILGCIQHAPARTWKNTAHRTFERVNSQQCIFKCS